MTQALARSLAVAAAHTPAGHHPSPIKTPPRLSTPHTSTPSTPQNTRRKPQAASLPSLLAGGSHPTVVTMGGRKFGDVAGHSLPPPSLTLRSPSSAQPNQPLRAARTTGYQRRHRRAGSCWEETRPREEPRRTRKATPSAPWDSLDPPPSAGASPPIAAARRFYQIPKIDDQSTPPQDLLPEAGKKEEQPEPLETPSGRPRTKLRRLHLALLPPSTNHRSLIYISTKFHCQTPSISPRIDEFLPEFPLLFVEFILTGTTGLTTAAVPASALTISTSPPPCSRLAPPALALLPAARPAARSAAQPPPGPLHTSAPPPPPRARLHRAAQASEAQAFAHVCPLAPQQLRLASPTSTDPSSARRPRTSKPPSRRSIPSARATIHQAAAPARLRSSPSLHNAPPGLARLHPAIGPAASHQAATTTQPPHLKHAQPPRAGQRLGCSRPHSPRSKPPSKPPAIPPARL
nr:uncharacterized protein LOC127326076 [Lolium perenne]